MRVTKCTFRDQLKPKLGKSIGGTPYMKCHLKGQRGGGLHKYCRAADPQRNNNLATSHMRNVNMKLTTIYKVQRSRNRSAAQSIAQRIRSAKHVFGSPTPPNGIIFQIVE